MNLNTVSFGCSNPAGGCAENGAGKAALICGASVLVADIAAGGIAAYAAADRFVRRGNCENLKDGFKMLNDSLNMNFGFKPRHFAAALAGMTALGALAGIAVYKIPGSRDK